MTVKVINPQSPSPTSSSSPALRLHFPHFPYTIRCLTVKSISGVTHVSTKTDAGTYDCEGGSRPPPPLSLWNPLG